MKFPVSLLCLSQFALTINSDDWLKSNGFKKHDCPHGVPLWINTQITPISNTFEPVCLQPWYSPNVCHTCNRNDRREWISGIECPQARNPLNCTHHCCRSRTVNIGGCVWTPLKLVTLPDRNNKVIKEIDWRSSKVKICNASRIVRKSLLSKTLKDTGVGEETETTTVRNITQLQAVTAQLPVQSADRLKLHCNGNAIVVRVNGKNLRFHNGLFCGNAYPCTKGCYEDATCTMGGRRNDFISGYDCVAEDNEDEPYKCKMLCCHSSLVELHNCTWHYPTDRLVSKGNNSELVLRRIEFFPYILEVCAVKKVENPATDNGTVCAWDNYVDPVVQQPEIPPQQVVNQPNGVENGAEGANAAHASFASSSAAAADSAVTAGSDDQVTPRATTLKPTPTQLPEGTTMATAVSLGQSAVSLSHGQSELSPAKSTVAPRETNIEHGKSGVAPKKSAALGGISVYDCSPLDMVFVVDSSHSLLVSGFQNELSLITTIMSYFDFSSTALLQSRLGIILFGNSVAKTFGLKTYENSATANSQLIQAVNSLPFLNSVGTDIVGGVRKAASMYSSTGARAGVRRVTILITDGTPSVPAGLSTSQMQAVFSQAAKHLQSVTGEEIYAVAATAEGQILTTNFGISSSHTSYTPTSSGLPGLAATVVEQICTSNTATSTGKTKNKQFG